MTRRITILENGCEAYFCFLKFYSAGLEILEEIPEPDVVIVCCGGGGLLSGVAAAIKLKGNKTTRIFGVEPEGGKYLILSLLLNKYSFCFAS